MTILLIIFFNTRNVGYAQVKIREVYDGSYYYITNPLNPDSTCCCLSEVYLNDKLIVSNIKISELEIDLSFLDLGEPFNLLLIHNKNCIPRLEKHPRKLASFTRFGFTNQNVEFETKGDSTGDIFILEVLQNSNWIEFKKF